MIVQHDFGKAVIVLFVHAHTKPAREGIVEQTVWAKENLVIYIIWMNEWKIFLVF